MLLKTDELFVQHRNGMVFIPSYKNQKFLHSFLETFMTKSLEDLMNQFILLRNHYAGTHTFFVELSPRMLASYVTNPDMDAAMNKLLKESPWTDGSSRGIHLTTATYDFMDTAEVGTMRYKEEDATHAYMILRFQDDPDFYRNELAEELRLFKCFEKLLDEAIDTVVSGRERYSLLHIPLLVNRQFVSGLQEKIYHHNHRVCRLKPTRSKVAYSLEHHESGANPGELGSILLSITRAENQKL